MTRLHNHFTFRPIQWTGPSTPADQRRSRGTFRASWDNTLTLLDYELVCLAASDVVIEADLTAADIRMDGMPRLNARQPQFPGVRLAFASKFGPLIYATDVHQFWQHNVRAIALGLEALRAVDRYGVTKRGEQYTGWAALPAAPPPDPRRDAAVTLVSMGGGDVDRVMTDSEYRAVVYRRAARAAHPDHFGGDGSHMSRLNVANDVLRGSL